MLTLSGPKRSTVDASTEIDSQSDGDERDDMDAH